MTDNGPEDFARAEGGAKQHLMFRFSLKGSRSRNCLRLRMRERGEGSCGGVGGRGDFAVQPYSVGAVGGKGGTHTHTHTHEHTGTSMRMCTYLLSTCPLDSARYLR